MGSGGGGGAVSSSSPPRPRGAAHIPALAPVVRAGGPETPAGEEPLEGRGRARKRQGRRSLQPQHRAWRWRRFDVGAPAARDYADTGSASVPPVCPQTTEHLLTVRQSHCVSIGLVGWTTCDAAGF